MSPPLPVQVAHTACLDRGIRGAQVIVSQFTNRETLLQVTAFCLGVKLVT